MAELLGTRLKVRRAMLNLTQANLADQTGITRKSINAIETGKMVPSIVLCLKLAKALGAPVEELFYLEQQE
ncbi:MAG: helix-turn-helix transcriptional regulator [Pseudomonadota bacterium]